jgi:ribosomal protein S7
MFKNTISILKFRFKRIPPIFLINNALAKMRPIVELKPWVKSGIRYKIPTSITFKRMVVLAVRFYI